MSTRTQQGPRQAIMQLHELADLHEQHPEFPRASIVVGTDGNVTAYFEVNRNYLLSGEESRKDLEGRIAALVKFLDVPLVGNDPTKAWGAYKYELTGVWRGIGVEISTTRADVCEKVVVATFDKEVEIPDPELSKDIPLVKKIIKEEVTEWHCNEAISEARKLVGAR